MPCVLQTVQLVLRQHPAAASIPQIEEIVTDFLGPSPNLSLCNACRFESTKMLNWIWDSSSDGTERPWSLSKFLKADYHYSQWQFSKCAEYAAAKGNLEILEWLFDHFSGCTVPQKVVLIAADNGNLPVLQFLRDHDAGYQDQPTKKCKVDNGTVNVRNRNTVKWEGRCVEQAIRKGHIDVAKWLVENTPRSCYEEFDVIEGIITAALNICEEELAQLVVPRGRSVLDFARLCKHPDVIERVLDAGYFHREEFNPAIAIRELACTDRLDLMKRISSQHHLRPVYSFIWRDAYSNACSSGNSEVLRWLLEYTTQHATMIGMRNTGMLSSVLQRAAEAGQVDAMQLLYEQGAVDKFGDALLAAVRNDQLCSVR